MQKTSKGIKRNVLAFILWTVFLIIILTAPIGGLDTATPGGFEHFDKMAHFCLFAITGFVSVFGVNFRGQFKIRVIFGAIFGLFLAVSTEYGQSLLPFRNISLYDLLADVFGVGAGLTFYALLYSRYTIRSFLRL